MMRQSPETQTILDAVSRTTATFTAATTDIITVASHGLSVGDRIEVSSTTTLPAGLSANTIYYVMAVTTDTFKVTTNSPDANGTGTPVDITDTGTGTHTYIITDVGNSIRVESYRHKEISIGTAGMGAGDTTVVKIQGSSQEASPDFNTAKLIGTNEWDYIQLVDQEDGSTVDGDTGISIADADDLRKLVINVDGLVWVCAQITTQSDVANTSVTVKINLYND